MLSEQCTCCRCSRQMSRETTQHFPIFALRLPAKKAAHPSPNATLLIFLFSTACNKPSERRGVRVNPQAMPAGLLTELGASRAPNHFPTRPSLLLGT